MKNDIEFCVVSKAAKLESANTSLSDASATVDATIAAILSLHSEYFKDQFAKHKNIKYAILKNIDYDEFIELLSVIYPTSYPIRAQNVETIAKLAYVFKVRGIMRQCEAVLIIYSSRFGALRTFLMSHWYGMEQLQAKRIGELKAIGDLKKLKDEPEFTLLDCRTKAILLDKFVECNPVVSSSINHIESSGVALKARACVILIKLDSSALVEPDGILIVENKKIPIHKSLLAISSEYFKAMFLGKFKEKYQDEIVLEEVSYSDILELLAVIYPCSYPVAGNEAPVKAKCIDELKAIGDLKKLKDEPEFTLLDCRVKANLLDKFVECNPVVSSSINHIESSGVASKARASVILNKLDSSALVDPDGVLIVENKKIPIHKSLLAISSEYFKAMFLGEFKEKYQDEIVLEEVSYSDILELLVVIYPCCYHVTEKNLVAVLKLADRFIIPGLLERCKEVLKSSHKIKRTLKLWLAQQYNFPDLQIEYAKEYKNVDDVKKLKAEPEYESLNDKTRSLIFDSITSES